MSYKSSKKLALVLLLSFVMIFTIIMGTTSSLFAKADIAESDTVIVESQDVEPRAILVNMSCLLIKNENTIRAQAQNKFTLFPGKVQTKVYLYSSETYTEDYTQMTLEATNYINDLDQGESISARVELYGQRYWKGRTLYLIDSQTKWNVVETETKYVPADE